MRVYISADLEGISGVVAGVQTEDGQKEFERARRLQTGEVNAAICGAFAGGATEVVVNDAHGNMRNLLLEELDVRAELVTGSPKPMSMLEGLDGSFDAVLLIGYHAQSGTRLGTLNHTWTGRVFHTALNGISMGEIGINAAVAGALGVPISLITGDQAAVAEAERLFAPPASVIVKQAMTRNAARCLPPAVARQRIEAAAAEAVRQRGQPFILQPPYSIEMTLMRTDMADMAEMMPGVTRVDDRTVSYRDDDMLVLYRAWRVMMTLAGSV